MEEEKLVIYDVEKPLIESKIWRDTKIHTSTGEKSYTCKICDRTVVT